MQMHYLYLVIAVIFETFGTSCLQASQQFSRLWPSVGVIVGFAGAFVFLSLTLKYMPVGIVYALWSGLGIVLIALIGLVIFGQKLDFAAIIGMSLIVSGILVINFLSDSASH